MSDCCVRCQTTTFRVDSEGRCPSCVAYDERWAGAKAKAAAERFPMPEEADDAA